MSSHYLLFPKSPEIGRLQGMQPVPQPAPADKTQTAERKDPAPDGQKLPPDAAEQAKDEKLVESVVSRISDFVQRFQRDLHFTVDKDSGRTVIKVIDSETEKLIRQIPAEETLRIARNLDSPESLILREQA
jgi:flagellar protein FlaG